MRSAIRRLVLRGVRRFCPEPPKPADVVRFIETDGEKFRGQTVLVTGAGRGIGRGIALRMAREGASVVVNDFGSMDDAHGVVRDIEALGGEAIAVCADVADRAQVDQMIEHTVERFGRIDIVVANAAVSVREPVVNANWDDFRRTIEVVQFGTLHTCQLAARHMIDQPVRTDSRTGGARGKIVIIGSNLGEFPGRNSAAYNMSKAATGHLARTMAAELTTEHINVNVVSPGWVDTPGERAFMTDAQIKAAAPRTPWGRLGTPDDIANVVAFLASGEADYITGATIRVDGGSLVSMAPRAVVS